MATLTGKKIKNTYDALLKLSDNDNLTTTAKQVTDGFGNNAPLFISTTQIGIGVTPEVGYDLHVYSDAKVGGNLTITGDLTVNGTTTTVDTDTLRVEDPLIELARLNTSADSVDIGFYGKYHPSGTTLYSGLFRDAGDGKYKLFKDLQTEPTTTVNTSGTGYTKAGLVIGNLETTQIDLGDNEQIRLGSSQDLKIYHNGTDSYIENEEGDLIIQNDADLKDIIFNIDDGGTGPSEFFRLDGSASETVFAKNIRFPDGQKAKFGTDSDLQIYHDTDNSYVQDDGTGDLLISTNGTSVQINKGSGMSPTSVETMAKFITDGAVELYYDNSKKLETTSTGLSVTGKISDLTDPTANQDAATKKYVDDNSGASTLSEVLSNGNTTGGTDIDVSAGDDINLTDTSELHIGDDADFLIKHNGTNTSINNKTGHLFIYQLQDDGDIRFFCDDGSGATENYLQIDGGEQRIKVFNEMRFNDSVELRLGTGNDLRLFHNATNSFIDNYKGDLQIRAHEADKDIVLKTDDGSDGTSNYIVCDGSTGAVRLSHYGTEKFETTSDGINVTGTIKQTGKTLTIEANDPEIILKDTDEGTDDKVFRIINVSEELRFTARNDDNTANADGGDILKITRSGNVGIGETSPDNKLHIKGGSTTRLKVESSGSNTGVLLTENGSDKWSLASASGALLFYSEAASSTRLAINTSGNVGINTTSPTNLLDIKGNGNSKGLDIHHSNGNMVAQLIHGGSGDEGQLKLYDSNSETVRISGENNVASFINSGNVGIGQTSPDTILHITKAMSSSPTSNIYLDVSGTNTAGGGGSVIFSTSATAGTTTNYNAAIKGVRDAQDNASSELQFFTTHTTDGIAATEKMRITSDGKVGIGTTAPTVKLHVEGAIRSDCLKTSISDGDGTASNQNVYKLGRLTLSGSNGCIIKVLGTVSYGAGNNTSGITYIFIRGNNASTTLDGHFFGFNKQQNTISEVRYVNISGNVFDIYIKYDGTFAGLDTIVETGGDFAPDLTDTGSTTFPTSIALTSVFSVTTAGAERLVVDSSGNLSLATATSLDFNVADFAQIKFKESGAITIDSDNDQSSRNFQFKDGDGSSLMFIGDDGNVGIGTTSPSDALEIYGDTKGIIINNTAETDAGIMFRDSADAGQQASIKYGSDDNDLNFFNGDGTTIRFRIDDTGDAFLARYLRHQGDTNSYIGWGAGDDFRIFVGGVQMLRYDEGISGTDYTQMMDDEFRLYANGDFHADGDLVAYSTTVSSDKRLKKDIKPIDNALDIVDKLQGVHFNWKENDEKSIGYIAQDVEKVLPEMVTEKNHFDKGEFKTVNYAAMVSIMGEAIKELRAEVEQLKKQIK
jgi:hypothetical protein